MRAKATVILGLRGTGKSNAARAIVSQDPDHALVYDPQGEFNDLCDVLQPKAFDYPEAADEFARLLNRADLWHGGPQGGYRLLIVDEAQRIAPGGGRALHPRIARFNAEHRHIPMGVLWIARRPAELHPEIINLADHLVIFKLPGTTDERFLEGTSKGLGKAIRELEDFECMYVDQGRHFTRCAPFPNMPGAAAEGA